MHTNSRNELQALIGDDYQLQWIIGHGGMSTVWLADDRANDREVAIKVLKPEFSSHEEFLARFRNEAIAAEGIVSDHVVATYDYREVTAEAGYTVCFIVMEYVRGESLADLLAREHQLDEPLALDVLEQAAHGLSIIHRMGLVHRDIKPGNIMITQNGQVKITDFGIAKAAAAVPLTRTGMVVGTAQYVSPEQAQGKEVTAASDIYSLGVMGYEMLAGRRPFTGDSSVSVALAHVNNMPPALSTNVSAPTRELIEIALRKDPTTRFADGNELALAVAAVRQGQRPPQPASAAMNQIAEEPSPTASTRQLAAVAQPTTIRPQAEVPTHVPSGLVERPAVAGSKTVTSNDRGNGAWIAIATLLGLAALGAGAWAFIAGPFSTNDDPAPPSPEIVTSFITPSAEETTEESSSVQQEPTSRRPTLTEPRQRGSSVRLTTDEVPTREQTTQEQPPEETSQPEVTSEPTAEQPAPTGDSAPTASTLPGPIDEVTEYSGNTDNNEGFLEFSAPEAPAEEGGI
ncbi:protein kinase [Corynebacterium breve]|uniref:non-specific serine/threonine protein kinase n=1 Tax=Corynebacterium breve TaxID=3049799 RepID=A0ABY8VHM9_9CORY|nr:serine/threonine-protein kinase [Corynebacterium breve]WIM67729.1 protein kinase [Corynebacterium breve]